MRRLLLCASALALASSASARVMPGVHGAVAYVPLPAMTTITFGAETLVGFGGYHLPLGISMVGLQNASGASSLDFRVNLLDNDIVPYVLGGSYGSAAPAYSSSYTATLSDGLSTGGLTINIAPSTSTVKSHYGFAGGDNPDTSTSFQLNTVLASASNIHLGDTVIIRGGSGETGPTPALNPLNLSGTLTRYFVTPPETATAAGGNPGVTYTQGGNTGSPRIRIQCEVANTSTDTNGNPVEGGNCDVGGIIVNSTYDVSIPFDFNNIRFYDNHPAIGTFGSPATPGTVMLGYNNVGWGVTANYSRFEWGPLITEAYSRIYNLDGFLMRLGTADHDHFVGGMNAIVGTSPGLATAPDVTTPWYVTNSVFEGMTSDGVDIGANSSGPVATSNFFFNFNSGGQNPSAGDGFSIGPKSYTFVASGSATVDGQVPISPNVDQTVSNTICTIMAGGSGCVAGVNYPAAETSDPTVTAAVKTFNGPVPEVQITYSGATPSLTLFNALLQTNKASALLWTIGTGQTSLLTFNADHPDTFQYVYTEIAPGLLVHNGATDYNISIRGVEVPNEGVRQFYFSNINSYCCLVGQGGAGVEIKNNIASLDAANSIYFVRFNNPNVSSNTFLADVNSTVYSPSDPSYDTLVNGGAGPGWNSSVYRSTIGVITDGGGGATFLDNLANFVTIAGQTALGSIPSYTFTGNTNGSTALTVTSGMPPVASTPITGPGVPGTAALPAYVKSVAGSVVTLSAAVPTQTGGTFTTVDPFFGQPAGTLNTATNEAVNWSGSSPPPDQTFMTSVYRTFLPNYPTNGGVLTTNRAATIHVFTPSSGATFVGSITSISPAPYHLTVTSGVVPALYTPINGPDIPSGDIVTAVAGNVLTLLFPPTATGAGLTFGTGAMNPDGTYNGALFPNGCWNDNSVYNPATACAAAQ